MGSPGKTFNVAFDTTWTYSWIISSECEIDQIGCWFHHKYNHHKSSTYQKDGRKFSMNVGNYNLTGFFSNETFSVSQTCVFMANPNGFHSRLERQELTTSRL